MSIPGQTVKEHSNFWTFTKRLNYPAKCPKCNRYNVKGDKVEASWLGTIYGTRLYHIKYCYKGCPTV